MWNEHFRLFIGSQGLGSLFPCLDINRPPSLTTQVPLLFITDDTSVNETGESSFTLLSAATTDLTAVSFHWRQTFCFLPKGSFFNHACEMPSRCFFKHFNSLVFPYVVGKMWILMIFWWLLRDLFEGKLRIHISKLFSCSLTAKMHDLKPCLWKYTYLKLVKPRWQKKKSNLSFPLSKDFQTAHGLVYS